MIGRRAFFTHELYSRGPGKIGHSRQISQLKITASDCRHNAIVNDSEVGFGQFGDSGFRIGIEQGLCSGSISDTPVNEAQFVPVARWCIIQNGFTQISHEALAPNHGKVVR